jgi:hypothetical protein
VNASAYLSIPVVFDMRIPAHLILCAHAPDSAEQTLLSQGSVLKIIFIGISTYQKIKSAVDKRTLSQSKCRLKMALSLRNNSISNRNKNLSKKCCSFSVVRRKINKKCMMVTRMKGYYSVTCLVNTILGLGKTQFLTFRENEIFTKGVVIKTPYFRRNIFPKQ